MKYFIYGTNAAIALIYVNQSGLVFPSILGGAIVVGAIVVGAIACQYLLAAVEIWQIREGKLEPGDFAALNWLAIAILTAYIATWGIGAWLAT